MRGFVSHLTASLLLIHALAGCCWHHALAHSETSAPSSTTVAFSPCCAHRHAENELGEVPAAPCDSEDDNCAGVCVYLGPQKVDFYAGGNLDGFDKLLAPLPAVSADSGTSPVYLSDESTGRRPPPVRLHLEHQILLI